MLTECRPSLRLDAFIFGLSLANLVRGLSAKRFEARDAKQLIAVSSARETKIVCGWHLFETHASRFTLHLFETHALLSEPNIFHECLS